MLLGCARVCFLLNLIVLNVWGVCLCRSALRPLSLASMVRDCASCVHVPALQPHTSLALAFCVTLPSRIVYRVSSTAIAFASGMAATSAVIHLLSTGDHVICIDDVYGGTQRYFRRTVAPVSGSADADTLTR